MQVVYYKGLANWARHPCKQVQTPVMLIHLLKVFNFFLYSSVKMSARKKKEKEEKKKENKGKKIDKFNPAWSFLVRPNWYLFMCLFFY